jgi:predicted flap endonuclease-1-like 5' DNA nuclease
MKKKRRKAWAISKEAAPMPSQLDVAPSLPAALGERDDLTVIGGIEPVIEMALNSIGIRKLSDFAGYTPEILAQALQTRTGLAVTAEIIARQNWIVSAALLAGAGALPVAVEGQEELAGQEATAPNYPQGEESTIVEASPAPSMPEVEQERASEMVAEEIIASDPEFRREPSEEETESHAIALHIQGAQFESFEAPAPGDGLPENWLRVEMKCGLVGSKSRDLSAEEIFLCAQIHAVDADTGECKLLASTTKLVEPDQTVYQPQLEFEAPSLGSYRLQAVAFLLHSDPQIALYQGPRLRVLA